MDSPAKFVFLFISEGLFLALVAMGVWLMASRRQLRKERQRIIARNNEISTLRQRLDLVRQHLETANKQIKESQTSGQPENPLLLNYQQRIANLEKFKELYFELEDRFAQANGDNRQSDQLQTIIDTQNRVITDLKAKLASISNDYGLELNLTEELTNKIQELEVSASALQKNLDDAERQRNAAEQEARNADYYKQRVRKLEATEERLQQELLNYDHRIKVRETHQSPAPSYGAVRIKEVDDLKNSLRQRENEIRRLRQECDTIGLQYEELAAKSLAMASERDDLTDEQKSQLEELKQKLEENAAELARKQAECEMLENYYLELEQSSELEEASTRLQQFYAERNVLLEQKLDLNTQVENAVETEIGRELAALRQALAEKDTALSAVRDDYREIKEQFVQIAQAEGELRGDYDALAQECEKLRSEVNALKEVRQTLVNEREELEKVRLEYSKMESRYLALVQKSQ
jgi:chromosome segregation ATPase